MTISRKGWTKRIASVMLAAALLVGACFTTVVSAEEEIGVAVHQLSAPVGDGVYYAQVDLMNASNPSNTSMGNKSLRGSESFKQGQPDDPYDKALVVVKDGKATALVEFMPMGFIGMYGFMMQLDSVQVKNMNQWGGVYDQTTTVTPGNVLTYHNDKDGKAVYDAYNDPSSDSKFDGTKEEHKLAAGYGRPEETVVNIVDKPYPHLIAVDATPIFIEDKENPDAKAPAALSEFGNDNAAFVHVFVPVMFSIGPSFGDQYARLRIQWDSIEKLQNPEENVQYKLWLTQQQMADTSDCTDSSVAALKEAYAGVKTQMENIWPNRNITMNGSGFAAQPKLEQKDFSAEEQKAMAAELDAAVKGLKIKADDFTALEAALKEAKEKAGEENKTYTEESYAKLVEAIKAAEAVSEDRSNVDQEQVNAAAELLLKAVQELAVKEAEPSVPDTGVTGQGAWMMTLLSLVAAGGAVLFAKNRKACKGE